MSPVQQQEHSEPMTRIYRKPPWYIEGLAFECQGCGRCCAGPEEGYVWLSDKEVAAIAEFLGIAEAELREKCIRRVGKRLTICETLPSHDCMFLDTGADGRRGCKIYPVRPTQCRTWPHWPGHLRCPDDWARAAQRCCGVNRGKLFSFNEIEARRLETSDG